MAEGGKTNKLRKKINKRRYTVRPRLKWTTGRGKMAKKWKKRKVGVGATKWFWAMDNMYTEVEKNLQDQVELRKDNQFLKR